MRGLALIALALEKLEVAGRALERSEPARPSTAALRSAAPVHRRDRGRSTDESSEEERPRPPTPLAASTVGSYDPPRHAGLHARRSHARRDRPPRRAGRRRGATPTPRSGSGPEDRRRTSRRGRRRSAPTRGSSAGRGRTTPARSRARGSPRSGSRSSGRWAAATGRSARSCRPTGERSMASDRGAARRASRRRTSTLPGSRCDHFHVSGYALMRRAGPAAPHCEPSSSRASTARASASISRPGARSATAARTRSATRSVERRARRRLRERGRGAARRPLRRRRRLDPQARSAGLLVRRRRAGGRSRSSEIVDSTGAGDALAAGWIVGGPDLALEAAARCVQQLGAMPIPSAA